MSDRVLSAGVVLLHGQHNHYQYLLLRAYGYWDFPKGIVEAGESPLQGAIREVAEETAITKMCFRWGKVYCQTRPYNQGSKIARYYIASARTRVVRLLDNPELGRPEHSEHRWVSREEAWNLLTPRVQAVLQWSDRILDKKPQRARRAFSTVYPADRLQPGGRAAL